MNPEPKVFSTRDIYLAATLITLKFKLIGVDYQIEGEKRPIGFFKFDNSPSIDDAKDKYGQGLLVIEPRTFVLNFNALKAEIAGFLSNPHTNPMK